LKAVAGATAVQSASRETRDTGFVQNVRMVQFKGTMTPEIYARALRATGSGLRFTGWSLPVAGLIGLTSARLERPVTWGLPLFLILFGVLLLRTPRMTVKRAFATDRFLGEPFVGEADAQGMRIESEHGHADLPWTLMHKVALFPDMVIVYQAGNLFRILAREFFSDDESWQTFRGFAKATTSAADPTKSLMRMFLLWAAIVVAVVTVWFFVNRG
jgi:YcxB-like protein